MLNQKARDSTQFVVSITVQQSDIRKTFQIKGYGKYIIPSQSSTIVCFALYPAKEYEHVQGCINLENLAGKKLQQR